MISCGRCKLNCEWVPPTKSRSCLSPCEDCLNLHVAPMQSFFQRAVSAQVARVVSLDVCKVLRRLHRTTPVNLHSLRYDNYRNRYSSPEWRYSCTQCHRP